MPENSMGKEHIIGSRYMSTSDAADAFYAVPIREVDYGKTGFTALGKQWVFTVMLQGGINSARHFARIITETFDGVPQSKMMLWYMLKDFYRHCSISNYCIVVSDRMKLC
jgi:hypothetical protein